MFFRRLAQWELRHRKAILVALGLITVLSLLAIPYIRYEFRPEALTHFSQEEEDFYTTFASDFHLPPSELIIVLDHPEPCAALTPEGLTLLYQLTELARESELASHVESLVTMPRDDSTAIMRTIFSGSNEPPPLIDKLPVDAEVVKRAQGYVSASELIKGTLVSHDGSAALVLIELKPEFDDTHAITPAIDKLSEAVDALVQGSGHAGTIAEDGSTINGYMARFGGLPFVRVAVTKDLQRSQLIFTIVIALTYFLLLFIIFRRLPLAALPLVAVGLAVQWTTALIPVFGLNINIINTMLPTLILVVGVCNAIHVLLRMVDERNEGAPRETAIARAIHGLGMACLLTSLTTAVGFFSLVLAHAPLLREFGLLVALGIMLSYVSIMLTLPVAASFFKLRNKKEGQRSASALGARIEAFLERLTDTLLAHTKLVLVGSLLFTAGALYLGSLVKVDARALEGFEEGHPVYETNQVIETKLGGILPLEIVLTADEPIMGQPETLKAVHAFQGEISNIEGVISTLSVVDMTLEIGSTSNMAGSLGVLRAAQPRRTERFITPDSKRLRVTARLADLGIQQVLSAIESIRASAKTHLGPRDLEVRMTGTAYLASAGLDTFVRDLYYSLIMASAIIFLIVTLTFRSLRVGLISILPNAIPLASTLACIKLFGYDLNASTVLVLTISIGLAVDNTIHFISRFIEEVRAGHDEGEAIRGTFKHAGRAIIYSNFLLMVGFATLIMSAFPPSRKTAVLTVSAIGVAMVAAIITLPVLLVLFGGPVFQRFKARAISEKAMGPEEEDV